jgi:NAD kinase
MIMEIEDVLVVSKNEKLPIERPLYKRSICYENVVGYLAVPEDFIEKDLIIAFGGDGTMLDASKNILDDTPILAIKSSDESVGALCQADAEEFDIVMDNIIRGKYEMEQWNRVEGSIDDKIGIALNEIFVGPRYSSGPGRYVISIDEISEEQRGSGMLVASGTGSSGFYNSVCGSEGPFSRTSKQLKSIALHPSKKDYIFRKVTVDYGKEIEIESLIKFDGTVDFDGYNRNALDFPKGSELKIKLSEKPLNVIIPEKNYK